jgi:hypothetical protein
MKSADVVAKHGRISFLVGMASDADDLLYELSGGNRDSRRTRRMKTGDLLSLQYRVAGLSRSVFSLEHFVLRSMVFGQIRPHTENFKTIDKDALLRYSISGENPIVLAKGFSSQTEIQLRLRELIGLFKYMCIRGVRYDFVILYEEMNEKSQTERERVMRHIRRAGCEDFVSFSCGIFLVNETTLTQEEKFSYEISADAIFDLSYPPQEAALENARAVPLSAEVEALLKKEIETRPMQAQKPDLPINENGPLLEKPHDGQPFVHVLASSHFGAVLTENSLGMTFSRDAVLGNLEVVLEGVDVYLAHGRRKRYAVVPFGGQGGAYVDYLLRGKPCAELCAGVAHGFLPRSRAMDAASRASSLLRAGVLGCCPQPRSAARAWSCRRHPWRRCRDRPSRSGA